MEIQMSNAIQSQHASSQFRTSDTFVAAFLVATGHTLRGLDGPRGRREFLFDEQAEHDRLSYFADGLVSARKFANAYKDLKSALFELK
jgi:hypothetical protein